MNAPASSAALVPTASGPWVPQPAQVRGLRCPTKEMFWGGSAGSGKSDLLLVDATRYVSNPNHRALLLRRTFPDMRRFLLARSHELYPRLGGRCFGTTWKFPSEATIELGFANSAQAIRKFQGSPYNWIGFDELTHFDEESYTFMFSRLRSAHGLPLFMRAASNPGSRGHDWVLERFAPWLYPPGHPGYDGIRAEPGQTLWYTEQPDGTMRVGKARTSKLAHGRVFFPARLSDNKFLAGTDYELSLAQLPMLTRAQQRDGDWMVVAAPRQYFRREWVEFFGDGDALPRDLRVVRRWDLASTEPHDGNKDPDWTVGAKVAFSPSADLFYVLDVVRLRKGPGDVQALVKATAELDGRGCKQRFPIDPGQAGKDQLMGYVRLLRGFDVGGRSESGSKEMRFGLASAQMNPQSTGGKVGKFRFRRAPWTEAAVHELEMFPMPGYHDDIADAVAGAFLEHTELREPVRIQATQSLGMM